MGDPFGVPVGYAVGCKWTESAQRWGEGSGGANHGHGCPSKP